MRDARPTANLTAAEADELQARASRELRSRSLAGIFIYCLFVPVILLGTPYPKDHPGIMLSISIISVLLAVFRYALSFLFDRISVTSGNRWLTLFSIGTVLAGVIWGSFTGLTLYLYGVTWTSLLIVIITTSTSSGAVLSLFPRLSVARIYLISMNLPTIIVSIISGSAEALTIGTLFTIFLFYILVQAGRQHTQYWTGLVTNLRLQERTRQLEHAKETALTASHTKSDFLANMSHEIRTPMNGIIGLTEVTLDTELTSEQQEYLRRVLSSAEWLLDIINDILDISKIEAGRLVLAEEDFDLRECLNGVVTSLSTRAEQKQLTLECRIPDQTPERFIGDPGRIRQVLINLLGNAIKFTDHGEVILGVERGLSLVEETEIHFTVTDTGIGIPKDEQTGIFEAFVQGDGSTTRKYGGTGLGLAITTQLASLMGGRIWVESEPGRGSTFHFTARLGTVANIA